MPKSTRSRRHRKSRKNNLFGGSMLDSASQTGTQVLNTIGNSADQAGTGIQNFFTDGYNKLFKKNSTTSAYPASTGGRRSRRGGRSRSRRGGFSFPKNPSQFAEPVNYNGGRRSRRGGYSFPQALSVTAAPTTLEMPFPIKKGGRRSKRGGFYKAFSDRNYNLAGRGPPISGAPVPGTTAQPHHWVGKAQRWVGPSGNAAFLH